MLIQFSVANFRSIRERQTLSLVANSGKELPGNLFSLGRDNLNLLHSIGIYGGNATGKSNLLVAMHFAQSFVISSAKDMQKGEPIEVEPFRLSAAIEKKGSEFEFIFVQNGTRYQYGFSVTKERVVEEYLFVFKTAREQTWFHRVWDEDEKAYQWVPFGKHLKGNLSAIKQSTRDNALFVSTAVQLNNEALFPIVYWFQRVLAVVPMYALHYDFSAKQVERSEAKKNEILHFMQTADIEIKDILIDNKQLSMEDLPDDMPETMKSALLEPIRRGDGAKVREVSFLHGHNDSGEMVPIGLDDQSRGTQALFAAAGPLLDVLENGRVLVVDEIDSSLHPTLVRFIVGLFHDPETNPNHAQLIFVTHDTTLQDPDFMRRDQIWFVKKDAQQSTVLYPLSDYSPRKHESLQKGYLHGRYGGLPNVGRFGLPKVKPSKKEEEGAQSHGEG
jgi:AAA15 family ATPase/GTPase